MSDIKKTAGFAIICPFDQYINQKKAFFDSRENVKVVEEIKTLFVGEVEVPDPAYIGHTKKVQALMIAWAIVFEEKVKELQLQHE